MAELTGSDDINAAVGSFRKHDEDELELAAIEKLQAQGHLGTSVPFDHQENLTNVGKKEEEAGKTVKINHVAKFGALERHAFIDKLLKKIEEDNQRLLLNQRQRIDRVGLELPTVEVRYKNLCIEAECEVVHGEPLPTLWNTLKRIFSGITNITGHKSHSTKIKILQDISGIIKPSRMTLLLGPPGCGKTTLLLALAGTLEKNLEVFSAPIISCF